MELQLGLSMPHSAALLIAKVWAPFGAANVGIPGADPTKLLWARTNTYRGFNFEDA